MPKVTSKKQITANLANSTKSTGPSSPEGKKTSCMNSLAHGLRARDVVLTVGRSAEDAATYQALLDSLLADFQPQTALERGLVKRLAACFWRSRRALRLEQASLLGSDAPLARRNTLQSQLREKQHDLEDSTASVQFFSEFLTVARPESSEDADEEGAHVPSELLNKAARLLRIEPAAWTHFGVYARVMEKIDDVLLKHRRRAESLKTEIADIETRLADLEAIAAIGSIPDAGSLAALARYESTNDRQLHRLLYQLLGKRKGPLQLVMRDLRANQSCSEEDNKATVEPAPETDQKNDLQNLPSEAI